MLERDHREAFYFQWHITNRCNLHCKHCYQNSPEDYKDLAFSKLTEIADIIETACEKWQLQAEITLTGSFLSR